MPDKAGDWKAVLHFDVTGAGKFTMNIADGKIEVAEGAQGTETCLIKMSYETFIGMGKGEIDGNQAFMQGKITATNMKDMMKYGTSFHGAVAGLARPRVLIWNNNVSTCEHASLGWAYDCLRFVGLQILAVLFAIFTFIACNSLNEVIVA